jgi:hypothetical protein
MNQAVIARQIEIWEQMVGRKREFSALDLLVDAVAKKESKY